MARRTVTASNRASAIASPTPHAAQTPVPSSSNPDLALLRRQWKWAAFSQFFYTFFKLFAMDDVTIMDIEEDLVHSRAIVLPRVMARMLSTLSGDKKTNLDNWQLVLRRQYMKRNPDANPLGSGPPKESADYEEPVLDAVSRVQSTAEPDHEPKLEDTDGTVPDSDVKNSDAGPSQSQAETGTSSPAPDEGAGTSSPARAETAEPSSPEPFAEESKDWLDLPMLEKLDSMHTIAEWHFDWPQLRIRKIMRDDDEGANWRIEPIGYDFKTNAYWLIGPDRLWIQRSPPKPPRPPKRKRAPPKPKAASTATKKGKQSVAPVEADYGDDDPEPEPGPRAAARSSRARPTRSVRQNTKSKSTATTNGASSSTSPRKGDRAAKRQANIKLDAQAKAFAEYRRQAAADHRRSSKRQKLDEPTPASPVKAPPSRAIGTRVSRRLRGSVGDEEWQQIPEEWLKPEEPVLEEKAEEEESMARRTRGGARRTGTGTGLESDTDSDSELTSLSDESPVVEEKVVEPSEPAPPEAPADFVEWELIAVTLYEWEHVAEQFAGSTHYSEKALYKRLANDIVPVVTEQLRELEKKKKLEEAIVHRKRSSRIAFKESAREQARMEAEKRMEEEKALARARRAEARQKQEEEARTRREEARERRRREKEEKEEKGKEEEEKANNAESSTANGNGLTQGSRFDPSQPPTRSGTASGVQTPSTSDWEVDCEVCSRRGINLDGDIPLVQCEVCKKWQHQRCHDRVDDMTGRRRRNWNHPEYHFMCQACQPKLTPSHSHSHPSYNPSPPQPPSLPVTPGYPSKNITLQWNHARSGANNIYPATGTTPYPGTGGYVGNQTYAPAPTPLNGHAHYGHQQPSQQQGYGAPIQFDYYQPPGPSTPTARGPPMAGYGAYGQPSQPHSMPQMPGRWGSGAPAPPSMNGYNHTNGLPPPPPQPVQVNPGPWNPHGQRVRQPQYPPLQPRMDFAPS
ncbi:hypothetical protein NEOLEDRAFT_1183554 [Neolentinus lepideus HHB14362 ss-1]|uniref:PHD-type domain-containing protein n=1 Tax=Neolentinus lepideus HHB14362 ss-1 TaxID=1314782 RepID=A0A165N6I3_9AGAM|nr:hypothetical protein NEOLEDRAFT_1183554 [Neolentinus lepideus HHB14362 ss-1]